MTHFLLISDAAQVYEGFDAYVIGGESLFYEVDDIVAYLIVACDDETAVRASQQVTHQKGLHATITLFL